MGVYDYMGWEAYFDIPTIIASAMGIVVTLVYFKAQGKTQRAVLVGELLLLAQAVLGLASIAGASAGAEMGPAANAVCLFGVEAIYVLLSFVTLPAWRYPQRGTRYTPSIPTARSRLGLCTGCSGLWRAGTPDARSCGNGGTAAGCPV